jgi:hypothetical protein
VRVRKVDGRYPAGVQGVNVDFDVEVAGEVEVDAGWTPRRHRPIFGATCF